MMDKAENGYHLIKKICNYVRYFVILLLLSNEMTIKQWRKVLLPRILI